EQEYGLPTSDTRYSRDSMEHVASLEVLEEDFEALEDPSREEQEEHLPNSGLNETRAEIETGEFPAQRERRVTRFELSTSTPTPAGEQNIHHKPQTPENPFG